MAGSQQIVDCYSCAPVSMCHNKTWGSPTPARGLSVETLMDPFHYQQAAVSNDRSKRTDRFITMGHYYSRYISSSHCYLPRTANIISAANHGKYAIWWWLRYIRNDVAFLHDNCNGADETHEKNCTTKSWMTGRLERERE